MKGFSSASVSFLCFNEFNRLFSGQMLNFKSEDAHLIQIAFNRCRKLLGKTRPDFVPQ